MRKIICLALLLAVGGGIYVLSALHTAWQIREAMRAGDTATLERRVDWVSVRQSMKRASAETQQVLREITKEAGAGGAEKPSLWQRIKSAAAPYVADPLIDRYVTAKGAPQLWAWRQLWRQRLRPGIGLGEPPTLLAGTWLGGTALDRGLTFARRIEHFAFGSPTRIELALRDRYQETRRWHAILELREMTWMLTSVHASRIEPRSAEHQVHPVTPAATMRIAAR